MRFLRWVVILVLLTGCLGEQPDVSVNNAGGEIGTDTLPPEHFPESPVPTISASDTPPPEHFPETSPPLSSIQTQKRENRWSMDVPISEVNVFKPNTSKSLGLEAYQLLNLYFVEDENGKIVSVKDDVAVDVDDQNNIYRVWVEGSNIHLIKVDRHWNEIIQDITIGKCSERAADPFLFIRNNNIYLVFRCEREIQSSSSYKHYYKLFFSKLSLDGIPIQDSTEIIREDISPWDFKASFDSDESINVVYTQSLAYRQSSEQKGFYIKTDSSGNRILGPIELTIEQHVGRTPNLVTDSNDTTHIIWVDGPKYYEPGSLYYGQIGKSSKAITKKILATGVESGPSMSIDSQDNIHIAWQTENRSIEYLKLKRTGEEIERETIIKGGAGPSISVDSNDEAHIVWGDFRYQRRPIITEDTYFQPYSGIYYKTTMDISEIEEGLSPLNPPIEMFVRKLPRDPLKLFEGYPGYDDWKSSDWFLDKMDYIRGGQYPVDLVAWGTGIKGMIFFIYDGSEYYIDADENISDLEEELFSVKGGESHFFKFKYVRGRDFLSAAASRHEKADFEDWDAKIDVTDLGEGFLLNITFRQPIQNRDTIAKKLDSYATKTIQDFVEDVNYEAAFPGDPLVGEVTYTNAIGENGHITISKSLWMSEKSTTTYTNIAFAELNKKILEQLKDSLFGEKEYFENTYHPIMQVSTSEYDRMFQDTYINYTDGSDIVINCVNYSALVTCSMKLDDEYFYLVHENALFVHQAIEAVASTSPPP